MRQRFPDRRLADVAGETRARLERSGLGDRLAPGSRVAIGVGSRGIADVAVVVREVVRFWVDRGMDPFIVPAMGSHGASTPAGQADVLAHLGVTQAAVGCPIASHADVVDLGATDDGIPVCLDAAAHGADGVMVVGRVKWHTSFAGRLESGLMKMTAIGLGKFAGAHVYHAHARRLGLEHVIRTVGRHVLQSGRVIGGVAILEDAHHHTARVDVVPADRLERRDEENLALVKTWMPRLPCDVDVLIVDVMGKNISGTGMDAKVVNRGPEGEYNTWPGLPSVGRIFVRDLDPQSYGNAIGIGMADVTTARLASRIDWEATRVNALSAGVPSRIRLPVHFADDRECLQWIARTTGRSESDAVTFGWIRDTLSLDRIAVSPGLRPELDPAHTAVEGEFELTSDDSGRLVSPFG